MPAWTVEDHLETELTDVREVKIRLVGGDVSVTAAPGPARLEVHALRGGPVDVHQELGSLRIFHPEWAWSGWRRLLEGLSTGPEIRIFGNIRFPGLEGPQASVVLTVPPETRIDVSAVSAPVLASGLAAPAHVKTVSGRLTLKDLTDAVDAKSVSGEVEASGIGGDLKAKTVSGAITVVDGACRWLDAKTVSGDVLLDLDLDRTGVYEIVTVSGDVALRLKDPSVLVEATSLSGDVASDFDLRWDDHRGGRKRMRGRIGDGEARLFVKTVSGDLRLFRRRNEALSA